MVEGFWVKHNLGPLWNEKERWGLSVCAIYDKKNHFQLVKSYVDIISHFCGMKITDDE